MATIEAFFWTGVTLCIVWIILGIIALIWGSIFLKKDEDYPMTFVNAVGIILLGFLALMEVFNDISDEYNYLNR
jgi:uncharacterized protein with PQ loop repeat